MNTNVLQAPALTNYLPRLTSSRPRGVNLLLDALEHVEVGELTLITPEGERMRFTGAQPGPVGLMRIYDWNVLSDGISRGEIGFADAYIDGRWDADNLTEVLAFALANNHVLDKFLHGRPLHALWLSVQRVWQGNTRDGARQNVQAHYDLGNSFYRLWLDHGMTYSGALFEGDESRSLEDAQAAKYRRILNKLDAKPGDHILEIGCGWGGFAEAAGRQGLQVTGLTLSLEQADLAQRRMQLQGLDHLVHIELKDYREVTRSFDHVVSIGMFEHVGQRYWPIYFDTIKRLLKRGGTAMVQSITLDDALFEKLGHTTGFIEHYIFPGGMLPSKTRFRKAAEKAGLECREQFAFGQDYALTLTHWLKRFEAHRREIESMGFDEEFMRLWRFYLASSIASFVTRRSDVMQAELTHA